MMASLHFEADEPNFENFHRACRSCLSANAEYDIFLCTYEGENLATILESLCFDTSEYLDSKMMPKNICGKCISSLVSVCVFRKQYRTAQSVLQNMVSANPFSTEKSVSEDVTVIKIEDDVCENHGENESNSNKTIHLPKNFVKKEESDVDELITIADNDVIENEKLEVVVEDETLKNVDIENKNKNVIKCNEPIKPKCYACGITFKNMQEYINHRQEKKRKYMDQKFPCEYCGKILIRYSLYKHMRTHTTDKLIECSHCSSRFRNKDALKRHMKIHTGEVPYICEFCGKSFMDKRHFLSHRNRIHTGEKPYICEICGKAFADCPMRRKHKLIHKTNKLIHTTNKLTKENENLHKPSSSKCRLQKHSKPHTEKKPFQCKICLKYFSQSSSLYLHHKIHIDLKPHECSICQMKFRLPHHLRNHTRIHTGEKPYKCKYCSKDFNHLTNFNVHVRLHTGERPYKCEHCDEAFRSINGLKRHRIKHKKSVIKTEETR